jgi:hypothetical protein
MPITPERTVPARPSPPLARVGVIASWLLLGACGDADSASDAPRRARAVDARDSAGITLRTIAADPTALPVWTLANEPVFVVNSASTGDSTALSLVGPARLLADGGGVLLDVELRQLVVFDATGAYRRTLGRAGDGPGEIRSLATLQVLAGDTIAGFDQQLSRLSFWHADVGAVRQLTVTDADPDARFTYRAWSWQDSLLVALELGYTPAPPLSPDRPVARWPTRASLALRDAAGRTLGQSPEFAGMYSGVSARGDGRLPFSHVPFVALARDAVYFGSGDAFTIGALDPAFRWASDLRWPAQTEPLTADEVAAVREESVELLAQRIPLERAQQALTEPFLPELLPNTRPSIGRALVDAGGRLWVERFEAPRLGSQLQTPATRWTVLEADGTPRAVVQLPPFTRLEDVRGNRALVVRRDSLDVEYAAVFVLDTSAQVTR